MFGWGKKKEAVETKIETIDAPIIEAAPIEDFIPIAVYVGVLEDAENLDKAQTIIEARASKTTGVSKIETTIEGLAVATTLLVDIGSDASKDLELIFISARAGGLSLADELRYMAQVFIVKTDREGEALETFKIEPPEIEAPPPPPADILAGLAKSSSKLAEGFANIFTKAKLDNDTLDELEELLIMSDMGVEVARKIRGEFAKNRLDKDISTDEVKAELAAQIENHLAPYETHDNPWTAKDSNGKKTPRVIMFVGVNGSGKTTTIGKVAQNLKDNGHKIMLCAADTFRAAASEQLIIWGERAGVPVVSRGSGADSAGLAFDALTRAKAEDIDVLLIDTAGRLQNKSELMAELAKIVRVLGKIDETAPHEVWLVLDATVGQNAISQTEAFAKTAGVTALIMTKLDGTAKGGVLLALTNQFKLPIRFIGIGEKVEDLRPFSASAFAKALVGVE